MKLCYADHASTVVAEQDASATSAKLLIGSQRKSGPPTR